MTSAERARVVGALQLSSDDAAAERERRSTLPMPLRPSRAPSSGVVSVPPQRLPEFATPSGDGSEGPPPGSTPPAR